jgi:putative acyl-CoA dehydrogenase
MSPLLPRSRLDTHEVENQPPPLGDYNAFADDLLIRSWAMKSCTAETVGCLTAFGAEVGSESVRDWGRQANENLPKLKTFDRYGRRIDEVEFHPAYHALMTVGLNAGVASRAWTHPADGHVAHGALMLLMTQADSGVTCPMSMTYAARPALAASAWAEAQWTPRITASLYDPRFLPAEQKTAATMGMAMTEKQGGSDVRANTTRAVGTGGDEVELIGHKWFCSAPMSDAFLTLAYEDAGLSCFVVPRWRPDGARNQIEIQRLKDKLGDRSNASSEIEYHHAYARRLGPAGRGVPTIIQMVQHTRYDCMLGAAGVMRKALAEASWHAAGRTAFQRKLIDQPLMAATLADLTVEVEAAIAMCWRLGRALDAAGDAAEAAFARLLTPIGKYWVTKRCPGVVYECMEAHGGVGYVEETPMPRLFRQSPLNAIWEGSGNVIALDVARALAREAAALDAVKAELTRVSGAYPSLDRYMAPLLDLAPVDTAEVKLRGLVERFAIALQAAILISDGENAVADAFVQLRIDHPAHMYGASAAGIDAHTIVRRGLLTAGNA